LSKHFFLLHDVFLQSLWQYFSMPAHQSLKSRHSSEAGKPAYFQQEVINVAHVFQEPRQPLPSSNSGSGGAHHFPTLYSHSAGGCTVAVHRAAEVVDVIGGTLVVLGYLVVPGGDEGFEEELVPGSGTDFEDEGVLGGDEGSEEEGVLGGDEGFEEELVSGSGTDFEEEGVLGGDEGFEEEGEGVGVGVGTGVEDVVSTGGLCPQGSSDKSSRATYRLNRFLPPHI
jgi:hypothetical protein